MRSFFIQTDIVGRGRFLKQSHRFLLFLLIFLNSLFSAVYAVGASEKHVIGCHCGGFFSIFISVLNDLAWCERNGKVPVVNWMSSECLYYQKKRYYGKKNPWEYYFLPVSNLRCTKYDKAHACYDAPDGSTIYSPNTSWEITRDHRKWVKHALIDKYIKLHPKIAKKINEFYERHIKGKKTVAIHLRGTDKWQEVKSVPISEIIREANRHKGCRYFVATDEKRLLDEAIRELDGEVIFYPSTLSEDGEPVHIANKGRAQLGEEVLIEAYLLSKCDYFIHTVSNVSTGVLFLNPELPSTLLRVEDSHLIIDP